MFGRLRHDECGTNLVEAAIATPLLVLLTLGIVDFGAMLSAHLQLEHGVSEATRFAITGNEMDDPDRPGTKLSREASVKAAMRKAAPTLTIPDSAFQFTYLSPGASTWTSGLGGPDTVQKVTITYTWSFLTPPIRALFPSGALTLTADSTMKTEGRFE
jgi:Flp pilus assembly protein TadG